MMRMLWSKGCMCDQLCLELRSPGPTLHVACRVMPSTARLIEWSPSRSFSRSHTSTLHMMKFMQLLGKLMHMRTAEVVIVIEQRPSWSVTAALYCACLLNRMWVLWCSYRDQDATIASSTRETPRTEIKRGRVRKSKRMTVHPPQPSN